LDEVPGADTGTLPTVHAPFFDYHNITVPNLLMDGLEIELTKYNHQL